MDRYEGFKEFLRARQLALMRTSQFEAELALARQIKAHAPHCRVIFTVYEMKRLGRDAAELTAHGLVLEMLAEPLPGMYDPSGPGRLLLAFFAAMAETERENIRESTLEGLDAAARKGKHGGQPPVITDDNKLELRTRQQGAESGATSSRHDYS
ncbi:recombinase family protein [Streptosporangium vulgare]|uniref:Recombinase family protein n=1 Tax=Streptosporangium vulgare TaxID=46190 RepID=A0ABV5TIT0_9ACTN